MPTDDEIERIQVKRLEEMMRRGASAGKRVPSAKASGGPINLSDADFHRAIREHPLVVVDFWAPWCGPCRVVSPILDELSGELAGKVTFGKLNVDDNPKVAQEFGIQYTFSVLKSLDLLAWAI